MNTWLAIGLAVLLNVALICWPGWDTTSRRDERERRRR